MRKTLEACFYYLWKLFHEHKWEYRDYTLARDTYRVGPYRVCREAECQKIEYWTDR